MLDVVNLALPFFGLIFLGLACGKLKSIPDTGLAWMNFFIIYVALPVLFYRILAKTPLEQVVNLKPKVPIALGTVSHCSRSKVQQYPDSTERRLRST